MSVIRRIQALILLLSGSAFAEPLVIKPVVIGDNQNILSSQSAFGYGSSAAFAGERLVFLSSTPTIVGPLARFWSSDGTNSGTVQLSDVAIAATNGVVQFKGQVYFMAEIEQFGEDTLWVTDGTPEGTRAIPNTTVTSGRVTASGEVLFVESIFDEELLVTDGLQVVRLTQSDLNAAGISLNERAQWICGFGLRDFINFGRANDSNALVRYQDGVLTDVSTAALSFQMGGVNSAVVSGDSCFFTVRGEDMHSVLRVQQNGQVDELEIPGDSSEITVIDESFGEVFAYRINSSGIASSVVRLDGQSVEAEVVLEENLSGDIGLRLQAFNISRDFIYGRYYAGLLDPPGSAVKAIDRETGSESFTGITPIDFLAASIEDRELIIPFTVTQFNTSTLVDFFQQGEFRPGLNLHDIDIKTVYRDQLNPDNNKVFFTANGVAPGAASGLYTLGNQPVISSDVAGLWAAEGIPSQGLVIQSGMSEQGSRYLFVGVFSQANNQQYWLAGNADFMPGDDVITMDLIQVEGGNFFDDQAPLPNQEVVGQLTLSRSSCNGLSANFNMNDQALSRTVSHDRLANTLTSRRCVEE